MKGIGTVVLPGWRFLNKVKLVHFGAAPCPRGMVLIHCLLPSPAGNCNLCRSLVPKAAAEAGSLLHLGAALHLLLVDLTS